MKNNWEKEFDEKFSWQFKWGNIPEHIKFFIRQLLSLQKEEFKKRLERIKLDMDVVICERGSPYKDSDPTNLINELLDDLEKL